MKFQRYQLKKEAVVVVEKHHPWIFRSHMSSAAEVFKTGDKIKLVDASNKPIGYGIYDQEGLIAVRVLKVGATEPDANWIKKKVIKAISKRESLRKYTDAYRIIHGENDGFPGVVIEIYKETLILQVYTKSMDKLGRYVAALIAKELGSKNILLKNPSKRIEKDKSQVREVRVLKGHIPAKIPIREGKTGFHVDIAHGQKSGMFLDLRGLRKYLGSSDLKNKRVLNLFSYTGTLGLMAENAGAKEMWNIDLAQGALEFAKRYHVVEEKLHKFINADIFHWLEALDPKERFDLIIVDPPNMGTKKEQVPQILKAYEKLYKLSQKHLKEKGMIIGCCCTSRISRREFGRLVDRLLPGMKCLKELEPEDDHPVSFPEGDYLKIRIYR